MKSPSHGRSIWTIALAFSLFAFIAAAAEKTDAPPPFPADVAKALMEEEIVFEPFVFTGTKFPDCDFENPERVKKLIGSYRIETAFYDSAFKEVTEAARPGRYGAVVKVLPEIGRPFYRFLTLARKSPPRAEDKSLLEARKAREEKIEAIEGIAPGIAGRLKEIDEKLKERDAKMLAALDGAPAAQLDATSADRQWWVTMKRKFYGPEEVWPEPLVCPKRIEGAPAPVLREGTLAEAGMKPDAAEKIDEALAAWAAEGGEAFAVCIARRGIIVLHKAYGRRDGKPLTVSTKSPMNSITELLSATLMMMLVDQNLVKLDEGVDKYLPALRGIEAKTPVTVRHLYTHTSGLWGDWGDNLNDFEERLAVYWPHLEACKKYSQSGAGYALGGKIIEAVTGEAVPEFYKKHLLVPLGCKNTDACDGVPMDIARIAQMLLNRGSYGNMRFLGEATFEKMLPVPLEDAVGIDSPIEHGIGTTWLKGEGLGKGAFGQVAASGAILCIDPASELVIVMTRNKRGKNYASHYKEFIQAVISALADEAKKD